MALFKFRWPGHKEDSESAPVRRSRMAQTESVEDMRRRARHRLIGAAVLVALGVVGFPLLFDTQPRPIPVDVPIEIPDRNAVAPLVVPGGQGTATPGAEQPAAAMPSAVTDAGLGDGEEVVGDAPVTPLAPVTPIPKPPEPPRLVPEPVAKPEPRPLPPPEPKPEPKPEVKPVPQPRLSEAERARALLEGRATTPPPAVTAAPAQTQAQKQGRFIIQVGAFADAAKVSEVRAKLELAGLKTYTQVVDTKDGKRTRVRVGPFEQREQADKAAARIKGLGLPAAVLTL